MYASFADSENRIKIQTKKNPQTVTELTECRNQTNSIFGRFKRLACNSQFAVRFLGGKFGVLSNLKVTAR